MGLQKDQKGIKYNLLCSCGNTGLSQSSPLVKGKSKSCGCLQKEIVGALKRTHGKCGTRTYKTWEMMVQRCTNINYDSYPDYGGKGVRVCESWLESFEAFYFDMGDRPAMTSLNRKINEETGSPYAVYSKDTCEWASNTTQAFDKNIYPNNTSGRTGVSLCKKTGSWKAYISKDNVTHNLGKFRDFESAKIAREKAELEFYGYLKN